MSELQLLTKMETDHKWLESHFEDIQEKHEGKFVAVEANRGVITSGKTAEGVITALKKAHKNPAVTLVVYIQKKDELLIL